MGQHVGWDGRETDLGDDVADLQDDQELRDEEHHGREEEGRDEQAEQDPLAREIHARERVAGHRREDHHQGCPDRRRQQAGDKPTDDWEIRAKDRFEVGEARVLRDPASVREHRGTRLERCGDHPQDRRDEEDRQDDQHRIGEEVTGLEAPSPWPGDGFRSCGCGEIGLLRHRYASSERNTRKLMMLTTTIIAATMSAIAAAWPSWNWPAVGEPCLVHVEQPGSRLVARPASGHDLRLTDHVERGDDLQRDDEQEDRSQARDRTDLNCCHLLAPSIARGLIQVRRDRLQPGQQDDRVEADRPPEGGEVDREPGQRVGGQPADVLDPEVGQQDGQQTRIGC